MSEILERLQLRWDQESEAKIFRDIVLPEVCRDEPLRWKEFDDFGWFAFDIECRSSDECRRAMAYYHVGISVERHIISKRKKS